MAVIGLVLVMVGSVLSILGPGQLKDITNLISAGLFGDMDFPAIARIGILLVVIYGLSSLLYYVQNFLMITFTQRLSRNLQQDISRKINRVPLGYFNRVNFGDILSRVTNDVIPLPNIESEPGNAGNGSNDVVGFVDYDVCYQCGNGWHYGAFFRHCFFFLMLIIMMHS